MSRALIVGACSGIGDALLREHLEKGIEVYSHCRLPGPGVDLAGDASAPDFKSKLSDFVSSRLVTHVFFSVGSYLREEVEQANQAQIDMIIKDNLVSGINTISASIAAWRSTSIPGTMIVINSVAARYPSAGEALYGAVKSGLSHFSKVARLENLEHGIQLMEVLPGAVKTRMTEGRQNWSELMTAESVASIVTTATYAPGVIVNELEIRSPKL